MCQIEGPDRSAWTLPYIVTVNNEHPFGMYVSYPKAFDGERDEFDNRLKWYATTTTKDVILSAEVSMLWYPLVSHRCRGRRCEPPRGFPRGEG